MVTVAPERNKTTLSEREKIVDKKLYKTKSTYKKQKKCSLDIIGTFIKNLTSKIVSNNNNNLKNLLHYGNFGALSLMVKLYKFEIKDC